MLGDKDSVIFHLESSNKSFVRKRRRNMIVFFLRELSGGIFYSVAIPSLWLYLQKFHSGTLWFGLVISMYQFTAVISSPFIGRLYDKTNRTRALITLLNVAEMIGALVYSLPFSPWLPLIGRFISGLGGSHAGVINGEIAMTTGSKARVSQYALVDMALVVGVLFGPPFALLFRTIDFTIGKLHVDFTNAPGILGFILWLLVEVCNRAITSDVALDYVVPALENNQDLPHDQGAPSANKIESDESEEADHIDQDTEEHLLVRSPVKLKRNRVSVKYLLGLIYPSEILSTLMVYLGLTIGNTSVDVMIPLITQIDFGWGTLGTSLTYLAAAVFIAGIYILLYFIGKKLSEIYCLCISIVIMDLAGLILIPFRDVSKDKSIQLFMFSVAICLGCIALPVCQVSSKSLLSKVVDTDVQGYIQGIHAVVFRIGAIIAPIFGSFAFEHLYLGYGYLVLTNLLVGLWFIASSDLLKVRISLNQRQDDFKEQTT